MTTPLVELKGIVKRFPGTVALRGVDLEILPGEIHALVGENGAGKSTLVKCLTGAHRPDEGYMVINGVRRQFVHPAELDRLGIAIVYQDLKLAPGVSIAENIVLGNMPVRYGFFMDWAEAHRIARAALERAGVEFDTTTLVKDLKVADQEIVAIARALSRQPRLLILDEPTALLADDDVRRLFQILRGLVNQGVSVLYISHRLEEIYELCHRVTVLRDGERVGTWKVSEIDQPRLIEAIAGKITTTHDIYSPASLGAEVLRVEGATRRPHYQNVSFSVRSGEVVGLFGLVGAGKTELLKGIFGALPMESGTVHIAGQETRPSDPRAAIGRGVGFVPEDRKGEGILPRIPILTNVLLPAYPRMWPAGWVNLRQEREKGQQLLSELAVKYASVDQHIDNLSGGNQQKVVVAKWIGCTVQILLLDEPTAGIDVGARREILKLCRRLVEQGAAVVYASSYLPEILDVSDRVLVMSRGRLTGEFVRSDRGFDEPAIMAAAYHH